MEWVRQAQRIQMIWMPQDIATQNSLESFISGSGKMTWNYAHKTKYKPDAVNFILIICALLLMSRKFNSEAVCYCYSYYILFAVQMSTITESAMQLQIYLF